MEEDFYFEDDDDEEDQQYDQRSRSSPPLRRQPQRQRSRTSRRGAAASPSRPVRDEFDSPSMAEEELRKMPLEEDEDGDEVIAAPIVRSRRRDDPPLKKNTRDDARYFDDEDEWDDDYGDDDYDYDDDYDDDFDDDSAAGNFWSNPRGGLDPYPSSALGRSRRASRVPPSTAEPQPDTKRRGRSRSRSADSYGRPPPSRRRPGAVQKTTFRSGTPPPPPLMKNFYDRFFWFGFDPRETTSPTDRTMFGGTKGKFSGLDVIREVDGKPASRRGPHGERVRERDTTSARRRLPSNDDEWDDDYDDDDSDFFEEEDGSSAPIIPRPLLPGLSIEEKRSARPPPPRSRRRRDARDRNARPRNRYDDDDYDDYDDYGEMDDDYDMGRRQRRKDRKGRFRSNSEWAAGEVSSWFTDADVGYDDGYSNQDDDDEDYRREDSYGQSTTRRGRRRNGRFRRKRDNTPPILGLVDTVFGFDPEDINEKAKEYEERIGRAKPSAQRGSGQTPRARNEVSRRRRAGYAYRYEEDDGSPPVAVVGPAGRSVEANRDDVVDATIEESSEQIDVATGVIDIPAEDVVGRRTSSQRTSARPRQFKKRQLKRRSWEERESEEMDRIPPVGIMAYGPEGDIGMDARTFAALQASEEIREAKRKVELREERVIDAEEKVLMMKADVETQRRILSSSRRGRSTRARDTLRQMNMMVEDAARSLRKARAERDMAIDAMEELEDRHWVLLSMVRGDEEFARLNAVAEAAGDEQEATGDILGEDGDENEKAEWLEEEALDSGDINTKADDITTKVESLDDVYGNQTVAELEEDEVKEEDDEATKPEAKKSEDDKRAK